MSTFEFRVGSVVRLPRGDNRTGRATLSTFDEDNLVSLFWEDPAPLPRFGSKGFIVCPCLPASNDADEVTVIKSEIAPLLPFEVSLYEFESDPIILKERGDFIMKLGDASSAIPYYERALELTSKVQIGSSVLLLMKDTVIMAEIDCLDGKTADITYVASNDAAVVEIKTIILAISVHQSDLQVRVLLNLARALLQLSNFDNSSLSRPSLYREGAILACSMAVTILLVDDEGEEEALQNVSPLLISALFLRSKARAGRAKWNQALGDVDKLLELKPQSKQGLLWKNELVRMIAKSERTNKRLVKSVCQWIQSTTEAEAGATVSNDEFEELSVRAERITRSYSYLPYPNWISVAIFAVLIGLWSYKANI